jgi:hypothetical protein
MAACGSRIIRPDACFSSSAYVRQRSIIKYSSIRPLYHLPKFVQIHVKMVIVAASFFVPSPQVLTLKVRVEIFLRDHAALIAEIVVLASDRSCRR